MNRLEKVNATHNNLLLHEESNKENNDDDEVNENDKVLLAFKNALDSIKTWWFINYSRKIELCHPNRSWTP